MRLKTLLFNRGIFIQNMREVGWIGIGYFLCLFFAVPLRILMVTSTHERYYKTSYEFLGETLFRFFAGFQMLLMFTVPILLAIFIFRYMQVKLSADYIHSLPIRREALYHQNVLFGLSLLIIPVLLIGFILFFMSGFVDAATVLNVKTILAWVATTITVNVFVFMASVFVAMFTGISVFQGVLTYILLIFPAGIVMLFFMNVKYFLYGFAVDYYLNQQVDQLLPFVKVSELIHNPFSMSDYLGFIGLSLAFYVIAHFVYKKRKVEMATQAVAFRGLQPIFLYGVTICAMLLGGMYFGETQGSFGWRLFGYFSGSLLGYIIAQMILEKTWRIFDKWKGYGAFAICMIIVALFIRIDITGYENRIPTLEKVERVYFGQSVHWINHSPTIYDFDYGRENRYYYEDEENIERIMELHHNIIDNKSLSNEHRRSPHRSVVIAYELTNGKKIVRTYQVPVPFYDQPNETLAELMESDEYKTNYYYVLEIEDLAEVNYIKISSYRIGQREVIISDREDMKEFHQLIQSEISEMTYKDMIDERSSWATIEYSMKSEESVQHWINTEWHKSFDKIEKWLEDRNLDKEARITADDIKYAIVMKKEHHSLHDYQKFYDLGENLDMIEGSIRIEANDRLEECLRASSWSDSGEYVIAYFYKNDLGYPHFETISASHVPSFILEELQ